MEASHHMPNELKMSNFKMNSVVTDRQTNEYTPINSSSGYNPTNKREIEFQISTSNLADFSSLALCFNSSVEFNDLASNCIQSVQVFLNDEQIEYVENYNTLEQMLTVSSANQSHYATDMNVLQGAHKYFDSEAGGRVGDFVCGLSALGLTSIQQYLPLGNLRLVIKLEDANKCTAEATYTLNNVKLMMDTVSVIPSYEQRLKSLMRSEKGVAIPITSYESRRRQLAPLTAINMSYTELQSVFVLVDKTGTDVSEMPFGEVTSFKAHMNNKFFSMPVSGLDSLPKMYMAMKKSLGGSIHDATGHSCLDYSEYKDKMTILGVDCEKTAGHHELMRNGINTKENAYQFTVELEYPSAPANAKLQVYTLFKKVISLSQGGVKVLE